MNNVNTDENGNSFFAGNAIRVFIGSRKFDAKGCEIGFEVGFNEAFNTGKVAAWVQSARKENGEWREFGVPQRSKLFDSMGAANIWAYPTVKDRIAKLKA